MSDGGMLMLITLIFINQEIRVLYNISICVLLDMTDEEVQSAAQSTGKRK